MTLDVLVFDMDGTLYYSEDFIDTYIYYLTNDEMLRAEMLEEYKNVTNEFSKPDQQKFVYNDKPLGDLWQILFYIAEKFNISSEANNLAFLKTREKMINGKEITINIDLVKTVKTLNLPKVLMTNSPKESATPFIEYLNLGDDFDMYIYDAKKPDMMSDHVRLITERYPEHNIIKIGDNYHNDISSSSNSGIDSIYINHFNAQELHKITLYNLEQLNSYLLKKYMEV
ncbi:MAG TPA: HAD family hydrolase [Candidatus Jeotgalicoccus stercoravium]|nr:HAD family hydrolase [Candidatus Jeotgalicoccus stercoravium]